MENNEVLDIEELHKPVIEAQKEGPVSPDEPEIRGNEDVQPQGSCKCGRSPTGNCIGWHSLTEDEYQQKVKERGLQGLGKYDEPLEGGHQHVKPSEKALQFNEIVGEFNQKLTKLLEDEELAFLASIMLHHVDIGLLFLQRYDLKEGGWSNRRPAQGSGGWRDPQDAMQGQGFDPDCPECNVDYQTQNYDPTDTGQDLCTCSKSSQQKFCDNSCRASQVEIKQEINEYVDFLKDNDVDETDANAIVESFEKQDESEEIDINDAMSIVNNYVDEQLEGVTGHMGAGAKKGGISDEDLFPDGFEGTEVLNEGNTGKDKEVMHFNSREPSVGATMGFQDGTERVLTGDDFDEDGKLVCKLDTAHPDDSK